MGMITPVGNNVAMTAAVNAGISAYKLSSFKTKAGEKITMARVPDEIFAAFSGDIDEEKHFNPRHDRIVKMAIIALRETFNQQTINHAVPLLLAMPDIKTDADGLSSLIQNLANNLNPWIDPSMTRSIYSGRASGLSVFKEAYDFTNMI
jgi:3-oxoacyl-[acyl-carrier-protein] synthase-1